MSTLKQDSSLATQGETSIFYYNQDNLADTVKFGGLFGVLIPGSLSISAGELNPLIVPSVDEPNRFQIARILRGSPDLGELSLTETPKRDRRSNLETLFQQDCQYVFFIPWDGCKQPNDVDSWDSVLVVLGGRHGDLEYGDLKQRDGNDPLELTLPFNHVGASRLFTVGLEEVADATVVTAIIDVIFADALSCGFCVPFSSGNQEYYGLTDSNPGSPGGSSEVIGTKDGATYNTSVIFSLTGAQAANAMQAVGRHILVVSQTDEAHHIALKDNIFSATNPWSRIVTGYVATAGPTAAISVSPQQTFIGGNGGYVYLSDDVTAGVSVLHAGSLTVENVNGIHSDGQNVLTGHDNNVLLLSTNQGATFTLITGPVVAQAVNAVWIINATQFWAAMADGTLWYTMDGGDNWTQKLLPDQSNLSAITDIAFSPDFSEVGAISVTHTDGGKIYRTLTGGRLWGDIIPYIRQVTTLPAVINAVALSGVDNILAGGSKVVSADGILIFGE